MRCLTDSTVAFRSKPVISGHYGISFQPDDRVDESGNFVSFCKMVNLDLDETRSHFRASDFDVSSLSRAGATDLLKPMKPISPSVLEDVDRFDDGVNEFMSNVISD